MFTVNKSPSRKDLRNFAVAMLVGFGVIGGVVWCAAWYKTGDTGVLAWTGSTAQLYAVVAWLLGIGLAIAGIGPSAVGRPVYIVWMTVGVKVGVVMSTVLLTVLFFVLLPMFSLIVRLGDPIRKRLSTRGSYWEDYKPHEATLERMQRQF